MVGGDQTQARPGIGENRRQRLAELVDDRGRQLAHGGDPGDVDHFLAESLGFRLCLSPLGDVDHRGHHEEALHGANRIEADFNGDFSAVLPAPEQLPACPHRTRGGVVGEMVAMSGVLVTDAFGGSASRWAGR